MSLPNGDDLDRPIPVTGTEARRAAAHITRRLGDESGPVLEALGLIGYVGHETATKGRSHTRPPVWREGSVG